MENMEIYEKVRSVPENAQKPFSNGRFSGTDINPMWRIKKLTELFGPCGVGWYYEIVECCRDDTDKSDEVVINAKINLYIKVDGEWSKPIAGIGGSKLVSHEKKGIYVNDEAYKMAQTDALSVACKNLGIGADIYWDSDNDKYIDQKKKSFNDAETVDEQKRLQDMITDYAHAHGMTVKEIGRDYKINSQTPVSRLKEVYADLTSTADSKGEHKSEPTPNFAEIDEQVPF